MTEPKYGMKREDILLRPAYWFEHEQNELYRQVYQYMIDENINRIELSKRIGLSRKCISLILSGNYNPPLKRLIEISLAISLVPKIEYIKTDEIINKYNERLRGKH